MSSFFVFCIEFKFDFAVFVRFNSLKNNGRQSNISPNACRFEFICFTSVACPTVRRDSEQRFCPGTLPPASLQLPKIPHSY